MYCREVTWDFKRCGIQDIISEWVEIRLQNFQESSNVETFWEYSQELSEFSETLGIFENSNILTKTNTNLMNHSNK